MVVLLNALKESRLIRSVIYLVTSIILVQLIGNQTSFPDDVFPTIQGNIGSWLYLFSGSLSFSLGDVLYLILFVLALIYIGNLLYLLFKREIKLFQHRLGSGIAFITVIYLLFHLFWGFNYYKKPLKEAYDVELNSLTELKLLAEIYYLKAMAYRSQVEENEAGVFQSRLSVEELEALLSQSAVTIRQNYPELSFHSTAPANLKQSLFSEAFSYLGIGGYYNPFTNEGQFLSSQADTGKLFTKMHETAHQWGFATESEANFVGYLLGEESDEVELLYVSNFKAMRSLLNRIVYYDPYFVKSYVENRYTEGMKRDRFNEIAISEKYTGISEDAFSYLNETFLKINNQEGLASYGRLVELLVGFNRKYFD